MIAKEKDIVLRGMHNCLTHISEKNNKLNPKFINYRMNENFREGRSRSRGPATDRYRNNDRYRRERDRVERRSRSRDRKKRRRSEYVSPPSIDQFNYLFFFFRTFN